MRLSGPTGDRSVLVVLGVELDSVVRFLSRSLPYPRLFPSVIGAIHAYHAFVVIFAVPVIKLRGHNTQVILEHAPI